MRAGTSAVALSAAAILTLCPGARAMAAATASTWTIRYAISPAQTITSP